MIIEKIWSKFNISEGEITTACDGLDAIIMAMDKATSFSSKSNYFDMLSAIDSKIERNPIQWNCRHFKGQQDKQIVPRDRWVCLNVECDTVANQRWEKDQDNHQHNTRHNLEN